ncbi:MAG: hypothetical protein ACTS9Y_06845 [Methylophilus sp.]|uniref:hypothetical protein n=1 Tax=Methylophilus sp. TaxID=29541 RepID=UPI003FA18F31
MLSLMAGAAQAQPKKKNQVAVPASQAQTAKQVMSQHTDDLRALMLTLYELHPEELAKSTQVGAREMTEWVFDGKASWKFDAIRRTQQSEAIALIFDPDYTGDHILALVVGLETLLFHAYGGKNEYEIPVSVDDKPLAQVACELESLQKAVQTNAKQVTALSQPASLQLIQQALQTIIQRIRGQFSDQKVAHISC